jgi:Polyketide cyclase / dehydrase and lipid transport
MEAAVADESLERAIKVSAHAQSKALPPTVFALLKDGATWPDWTIFDAFELVRAGEGEPGGVGEIHVFSTALTRAREEIVELVPDRRLSYILLSGFPFKDYRADIDLSAREDGGTSIGWRASFDPKYKGTGWFWRLFMTLVLRKIASDLAVAAEKRAA